MRILLWAERQKLRRSNMVWITIFAVVMTAVIVLIGGQTVYDDTQAVHGGSRYIDSAGWYMSTVQTWATFFILPAVISLLGSYMICREEQDDTMKSLRLIPVNEAKLTAAKMILTFGLSILLYLLLFGITCLTELFLHGSDLSAEMIFRFLKEYVLDGFGVFLAISPVIAFVSRVKKGYWSALIFTEIYSFFGLFAGMSDVLTSFYPITAVFRFSGYYTAGTGATIGSAIVLLLCGGISVLILNIRDHGRRE